MRLGLVRCLPTYSPQDVSCSSPSSFLLNGAQMKNENKRTELQRESYVPFLVVVKYFESVILDPKPLFSCAGMKEGVRRRHDKERRARAGNSRSARSGKIKEAPRPYPGDHRLRGLRKILGKRFVSSLFS